MTTPADASQVRAGLAKLADPVALLEAMFLATPVGLQIYAPDGRSVLTNACFRELFGSTPPPDYNIFEDTILAERGLAEPIRRAFAGERIELPPIWYDPRELGNVKVEDGRRIAIRAQIVPLRGPAGAIDHVVCVFQDLTAELTARRQSDAAREHAESEAARAGFLAEAGRVLSSSLDYEGTLGRIARMATPAMADFCVVDLLQEDGGMRRVAAVHGDPAQQAVLDELRARFPPVPGSPQPAARVLETGEPDLITEIDPSMLDALVQSPDHKRLSQRLGARSVLTVPLLVGERRLGALSLGYTGERRYQPGDVPVAEALAARAALAIENARLYQEARLARSQAEAASRSKDEFLAMLGHELRNPLAPIFTALQLIEMREGKSRERSVIERQVRHLTRLVDDLLDVARITRGKIEIKKQPLLIRDVVARAVDQARPLLDQRRHHLALDVPETGLTVVADPVRLAQIVGNLLTNAAKYTPPGGQVSVSASRRGDEIAIAVRDNGSGIAPALLPHVFDQFVQGARTPDRAEGGLGIGLAIVKALVQLHGGRVTAESDGPGHGSSFTVTLPAAPADAPRPARSGAIVPLRSHGSILIVDDNVDAAELLAEALSAIGYSTHVVHDPLAALAKLKEVRPEVALLDIGLPIMDGYELAQRMRAAAREARIDGLRLVAVTGYGQTADRARALGAGFDRHLVKPVGIDQLSNVVASLLGRQPGA